MKKIIIGFSIILILIFLISIKFYRNTNMEEVNTENSILKSERRQIENELYELKKIIKNYEIIKSIIPDYENVILVGFSGGAVWGTIYSALIDKIKINFDIDGTFPHFYNVIVNPIWTNDFEYNQNYLWQNYDLWHFYMLSTMNLKNGIEERYIYNIYNSETYNFKFLYPFMKELNLIENHDVYLFNNQIHEISNDIENLILDISSKIIN